ncbi:MAG: LysM domain/BON superfamily protein [Spartobacteria bacterium]|nr:LysM domain/BON superfamily protein [Spartobacteria bacterium]
MAKLKAFSSALLLTLAFSVSGCDRMITPRNVQIVNDADRKTAQGDYLRAINLYEAALDDSPSCAEIHYKLALLYDDKMNDPLNALHHFKRYLMLNPTGSRANEVKNFMKRDEISLATTLSGDAIVTRSEAVRLKNENLNLRKEIEDRVLKNRSAEKAEARDSKLEKAGKKTGAKTYVVQSGDTLFSISRKFYKSSHRWMEIRDANKNKIGDGGKLKPGESLTIP